MLCNNFVDWIFVQEIEAIKLCFFFSSASPYPQPHKRAMYKKSSRIPEILHHICFLILELVAMGIKKVLHNFLDKKQNPKIRSLVINRAFWLIMTYEL